MISKQISLAIEEIVQVLLAEAGQPRPDKLGIIAGHPASLEHGDYSINIAMQLAKILKKPPLVIANTIKDKLLSHTQIQPWFQQIEVAAPGFINLYLNWEKWVATPFSTLSLSDQSHSKVIIEHTSINPNKSAHIGHLRNSCIGDTLTRMLKRTGHQVEVHNYIDDLGNQLADTVVGILHTPSNEQAYSRFGDFCWDVYSQVNHAYKENPDLQNERAVVLHQLEQGNSNLAWVGLLVAERIVKEHLEEMKPFNIQYDVLVWESSIVREGFWSHAFELLKTTAIFQQETEGKLTGCWVLKQPGDKDDSDGPGHADYQADKVLIRSNGLLTYTAKDIAYHLWKFGVLGKEFRYKKFADRLWSTDPTGVKRPIGKADMVINIIDHRQEYPQAMVKQALLALGFEQQANQLRHVSYGVVSLSPDTAAGLGVDISAGRHSYPMSGRQGIGIKVAVLLDQMEQIIDAKRSRKAGLSSRAIAAAAIRYYLLRFNLLTEVVFDLDQATEVSGNTGVYLLYSYARSCSILDKALEESNAKSQAEAAAHREPIDYSKLDIQEYKLMRHLAYWPETLQTAAKELTPNTLCSYVYELATMFNHFYAVCPILKAEEPKKGFRLWLTERFKDTLHDALGILGLPAPKRM
ncbi:arginine--tRNA ligase [Paenibacillus eucommiae]|uniref:Arginine--tRNA ligase n=1 Tax=Paenibacillus eucommiae TaxID=1355755 RepID=A0ABS4J4S4_9BACL|nr:arginine--tRNA ligase [Paenibacillus eucommiae]MBP1994833.1 arginyl-tRNA synthetase [Paenibacillus eucommiae]